MRGQPRLNKQNLSSISAFSGALFPAGIPPDLNVEITTLLEKHESSCFYRLNRSLRLSHVPCMSQLHLEIGHMYCTQVLFIPVSSSTNLELIFHT